VSLYDRIILEAREDHERQIALMKWLSDVSRRVGVARHVYVVGGAVRNFLIDRPIKDIDVVIDSIAAKHDSEWFAKQVQRAMPGRANLTTNQYGVAILTVKGPWTLDGHDMRGEVIEIANARSESYAGKGGKGYKPTEVRPATIKTDMCRREFTFNCLLWRMLDLAHGPEKAEVIDLTGLGKKHLEQRLIKTPVSPDKTFSDDPTRMLRAFKFSTKYDLILDRSTAASIKRNASKLKKMPWEASATLFVETILRNPVPKVTQTLKQMDNLGLMVVLLEMSKAKPFNTYLGKQLASFPPSISLLLHAYGFRVNYPWRCLDPDQAERLVTAADGLRDGVLRARLAVLKKPPIDNMALIDEFDLKGKRRGLQTRIARDAILDNPSLGKQPEALTQRIRDYFSTLAERSMTGWRGRVV
jgi:tRNA nucleotidyltransferase/poly(A) polymerase